MVYYLGLVHWGRTGFGGDGDGEGAIRNFLNIAS